MKVVEKGPGWSIQKRCTGEGNGGGGCGSLLEIEREDIYETSNTDMTGFTDHYMTFRCEVCGVESDISYYDVPSNVRILAKRRRK